MSEQRKRMAEVESTAISHRAEAASLYRQAESAKQEAASLRQELASGRDSQRTLEAELRGEIIGMRAEADATIEALRMQLTAATNKLKRLADCYLSMHSCQMCVCQLSRRPCSSSMQLSCKSRVSLSVHLVTVFAYPNMRSFIFYHARTQVAWAWLPEH